jgi:diguanylate cyclase (GGDEF)-like protein
VRPFEEIEDVQVKSYAYRMLGIMSILKLEYNDAETYFNKSLRLLEESNNGSFEEQYTAMTEIWLSRVYEETGRLPKCKEVLDKWSDYFMFESDKFQNLYLRDFIIPYYQAKCYYLCAENIKERNNATPEENEARARAVIDYIHEFMTLCEENHYEKAELYTLLKIQREYPTRNEEIQTELYQVVDELYSNIYTQQNKTYASVIYTIVSNSLDELRVKDSEFSKNITRFRLFLFSLLVVSLFILLIIILLINNRMDGMTGLLSRRIFDTDIKRYARTNSEYGVIMLDIDNFKNINDSYGHPAGDIVIRRLSQLISKETTSGIKAYRYGGEEFSIIVDKSELPYIDKIAERIRDYMEQQGWEFDPNIVITLSIGIAVGIGENIVKHADDNLYISKQTGKNRVTHL